MQKKIISPHLAVLLNANEMRIIRDDCYTRRRLDVPLPPWAFVLGRKWKKAVCFLPCRRMGLSEVTQTGGGWAFSNLALTGYSSLGSRGGWVSCHPHFRPAPVRSVLSCCFNCSPLLLCVLKWLVRGIYLNQEYIPLPIIRWASANGEVFAWYTIGETKVRFPLWFDLIDSNRS